MTKRGRGRPKMKNPMKRRHIPMPDELWHDIERYAADLSARRGKPVSASEAARRILTRTLRRRDRRTPDRSVAHE